MQHKKQKITEEALFLLLNQRKKQMPQNEIQEKRLRIITQTWLENVSGLYQTGHINSNFQYGNNDKHLIGIERITHGG